MIVRFLHGLALGVFLLAAMLLGPTTAVAAPLLLGEGDRLLVLAPHPDDEIIAAGGLIQEALALELPVRVCFFTMGDNNEIAFLFTRKHPVCMPGAIRSMGMRRQNEAAAAATQLGLSTNDLVFLGYPDSGTLVIWNYHWRTVPPFRSWLTRANSVPYDRALTPGSAYAGEDILDDLIEVIREFRPTYLVVPHAADHNVDHRALYLFARVAQWKLEAEGLAPKILAAPVHFTQWPEPRGYHPMSPAFPPHFLDEQIDWADFALAPFQVTNKLAALRRHHSQYLYSSAYLQSLIRKSELFGDFPDIALPSGTGTAEIAENDISQFRTDENLFLVLSRESGEWKDIAGQNAVETAELDDHDNDILHRTISGDGTHLTLSFQFRRPLSKVATFTVPVYGYRSDIPFGEMPKVIIALGLRKILYVRDLDQKLPKDSVELLAGGDDSITLRVPFSLLGSPEKILINGRISIGALPVDWVPWRAVNLSGAPLSVPSAPGIKHVEPDASGAMAPPPRKMDKPEPAKSKPLAPRVRLPRQSIPKRDEASEPVLW